jgi:uncharacterized membrane protein HdeD (DUF308 family)
VTNLNPVERPFQVTFLGWLFIVVGTVSAGYHLFKNPFDRWTIPIMLVGIIAIVAAAFLLRGARWSCWLLVVWLAFHVVISAFNSFSDAIVHFALLLVIGYFLVGPPTSKYFRHTQPQ